VVYRTDRLGKEEIERESTQNIEEETVHAGKTFGYHWHTFRHKMRSR